jgi:hypothetical protein
MLGLKGLKLRGGYGCMQNWKLQSIYGRINIRSITNNPWLQRMGKRLQRKSTQCLQTRCCRLGSNVEIESLKCKKNIMKNLKLAM